MNWLNLPEPEAAQPPAFTDLAGGKSWLAAQPQAQPVVMQQVLGEQIAAIDAARMAPPLAVDLLNLLHKAVIPVQASLEVRYTRKALPLPDEEERIFAASEQLWSRMGIAYLRLAPHFAPKDKCPLLHRAANAFRLAEFCHFQAGRECPARLDHLLFAVLIQAESAGILRQAHTDKDFPHLGEANIGGLLAWAFLLRLIDPYRLTAPQLAVANRALSRWRELCSFHPEADNAPQTQAIPLAARFAANLPEGTPHWLDIRSVVRKIDARSAALQAGETPESLKLGRELSATACLRLLADIKQHLGEADQRPATSESGDLHLVFGAELAYAVYTGEVLNPDAGMDVQSESLANQRMAVFGFDRVSRLPTAVQKLHIPGETWQLDQDRAQRPAAEGARRLAPCLIASGHAGKARLGVLRGLQTDAAGKLKARLDWYAGKIEAYRLSQPGLREQKHARLAVFLLRDGPQVSLILPNNAPLRPGAGIALEGRFVQHLVPTEVIERGIDFVRYACRPG